MFFIVNHLYPNKTFFCISTKENKNDCRNLKKGYKTSYKSDFKELRTSKKLHKNSKNSSTRGFRREKFCYPTALK